MWVTTVAARTLPRSKQREPAAPRTRKQCGPARVQTALASRRRALRAACRKRPARAACSRRRRRTAHRASRTRHGAPVFSTSSRLPPLAPAHITLPRRAPTRNGSAFRHPRATPARKRAARSADRYTPSGDQLRRGRSISELRPVERSRNPLAEAAERAAQRTTAVPHWPRPTALRRAMAPCRAHWEETMPTSPAQRRATAPCARCPETKRLQPGQPPARQPEQRAAGVRRGHVAPLARRGCVASSVRPGSRTWWRTRTGPSPAQPPRGKPRSRRRLGG